VGTPIALMPPIQPQGTPGAIAPEPLVTPGASGTSVGGLQPSLTPGTAAAVGSTVAGGPSVKNGKGGKSGKGKHPVKPIPQATPGSGPAASASGAPASPAANATPWYRQQNSQYELDSSDVARTLSPTAK
jgi:hypothetical protein